MPQVDGGPKVTLTCGPLRPGDLPALNLSSPGWGRHDRSDPSLCIVGLHSCTGPPVLAEICGSWVFLCSRMCSLPPALWEQVTRWEGQPGDHLALVVSQSSAVLPAPWIFWALGKAPQ